MTDYRQSDDISNEAKRLKLLGLSANRVSKEELDKLFKAGLKPASILDAGCGTGNAFEAISSLFPDSKIVGLEESEAAADVARQTGIAEHVYIGNILDSYSNKELTANGPFELIYIRNTLLHIPELSKAIAELVSLLSEDGVLFIQEPDWDYANANWDDFLIFKKAIMEAMRSHGINPTVGKEIYGIFAEQGLQSITTSIHESRTTPKDEEWLVIEALLEVSKGLIVDNLRAAGVDSVEKMTKRVREARMKDDNYFDNPAWVIVTGHKA